MSHTQIGWRALRTDDGPAWVELVGAIESVDHFGETFDTAEFDEIMAEPDFDPERDGLAALGPGDQMIAYGWAMGTESAGAEGYQIELGGGVHPDFRRLGIGRELLARTERRAAEIHRARHPGRPGHGEVRLFDVQTDRIALCERAGYEAVRYWFDMDHRLDQPLDEAPADPVLPDGLQLVPYGPALNEAVRRARNQSFAGHWGSVERSSEAWNRLYTGSRHFRGDLSFCVLAGKTVAAFALSQVYPEDFEAVGWSEAWLGQLGTVDGWRGRGLASALIQRVLVAYRDAGLDRAALTVDAANPTGALALYERHGFGVRQQAVTYRKSFPADPEPPRDA